jgi:hypothetical protein
VPTYCIKLYEFLSALNPRAKLFTQLRQMIEIALNQVVYDFAQARAQAA